MSRIDQLIAKLCPEGVEYKAIGDFGDLVRGNGMPKSDFTESGVGCIHYGQIYTYYGIWAEETLSCVSPGTAKKLAKVDPGDLIITNTSENIDDVCKSVAWIGESQIVTGGHATVLKHNQDPKYLSYYLQTPHFFAEKKKLATGTKVIDVSAKSLAKIRIPIPPLAVQREIVKVLDTFSQLEAELEAELEARRRQYQYYRDELLNFDAEADGSRKSAKARKNEVRWATLGEICVSISAGGDLPGLYRKGQFAPSDEFPYPIYSNGTDENALYGYTDAFRVAEKAVTISARGTIGFHAIREANFTAIVRLLVLIPNKDVISPEYLNYVLDITEIGHSGGSIPQLTVPNVKKIRIPVPTLEEQARIVTILDKFDALVNDLSSGLPAEIAARRRQYEHYRDRLLSFREAG
jgi:type I restriction enzyme, S subunit